MVDQNPVSILDEFNQPHLNERYERAYEGAFGAVEAADGSIIQAGNGSTFSGEIVQVRRPGRGSDNGDGGVDLGKDKDNDQNNDDRDNDRNSDDPNRNNDDRRNQGDDRGRTFRPELDLDLGNGQDQGQGQQEGQTAGGGFSLAWESPLNLVGELMEMSSSPGGGPEAPTDAARSHRTIRVAKR